MHSNEQSLSECQPRRKEPGTQQGGRHVRHAATRQQRGCAVCASSPLVICSWRSCRMHVRRPWWSGCKAIGMCMWLHASRARRMLQAS